MVWAETGGRRFSSDARSILQTCSFEGACKVESDVHRRLSSMSYQLQNQHLPDSLLRVAGVDLIQDGLSNGPFVYKVLGDNSYSLYSRGIPETGQVELNYQAPKK